MRIDNKEILKAEKAVEMIKIYDGMFFDPVMYDFMDDPVYDDQKILSEQSIDGIVKSLSRIEKKSLMLLKATKGKLGYINLIDEDGDIEEVILDDYGKIQDDYNYLHFPHNESIYDFHEYNPKKLKLTNEMRRQKLFRDPSTREVLDKKDFRSAKFLQHLVSNFITSYVNQIDKKAFKFVVDKLRNKDRINEALDNMKTKVYPSNNNMNNQNVSLKELNKAKNSDYFSMDYSFRQKLSEKFNISTRRVRSQLKRYFKFLGETKLSNQEINNLFDNNEKLNELNKFCKKYNFDSNNLNKANSKGVTPLTISIELGKFDLTKFLIDQLKEKNLRINLKNNHGKSPLDVAKFCNNKKIADLINSNDQLICFAKKYGFDSNNWNKMNSKGVTPLTLAVEKGNLDLVGMLIKEMKQKKIEINKENKYGYSPLYLANHYKSKSNKYKNINSIIESNLGFDKELNDYAKKYGFDVNNWNKKNRNGVTPLTLAVEKNNISVFKKLVKNKADVNLKNAYGFSAKHLISHYKRNEFKKVLGENVRNRPSINYGY